MRIICKQLELFIPENKRCLKRLLLSEALQAFFTS